MYASAKYGGKLASLKCTDNVTCLCSSVNGC